MKSSTLPHFPKKDCLYALLVLICGDFATAEIHHWAGDAGETLTARIALRISYVAVCGAFFGWSVWRLHCLRFEIRDSKALATAFTAGVVSAGLLARNLHDLFHFVHFPGLLLAGVAVLLLRHWFHHLHHLSRELVQWRTVERTPAAEFLANGGKIEALILFVSPPNWKIEWEDGRVGTFPLKLTERAKHEAGHSKVLTGETFEGDRDGCGWNWQQLFRAVEPHREGLRRIILVGSQGPGGSAEHLPSLSALLRRHLPEAGIPEEITTLAPASQKAAAPAVADIDFEDTDTLIPLLYRLCHDLKKSHGIRNEHIAVEVTGGQKSASIAGAICTLNENTLFQYVQTDPALVHAADRAPGVRLKAMLYDVRYTAPPHFPG